MGASLKSAAQYALYHRLCRLDWADRYTLVALHSMSGGRVDLADQLALIFRVALLPPQRGPARHMLVVCSRVGCVEIGTAHSFVAALASHLVVLLLVRDVDWRILMVDVLGECVRLLKHVLLRQHAISSIDYERLARFPKVLLPCELN